MFLFPVVVVVVMLWDKKKKEGIYCFLNTKKAYTVNKTMVVCTMCVGSYCSKESETQTEPGYVKGQILARTEGSKSA